MQLKIGLNLIRNYSYNFSTPKRGKKFIKFIIIHYTGMKKEADAIKKLCDPRSKVSSHYLIKNNGEIRCWTLLAVKRLRTLLSHSIYQRGYSTLHVINRSLPKSMHNRI